MKEDLTRALQGDAHKIGKLLTPEAGDRRYYRPFAPEKHGWLLVTSAQVPDPALWKWLHQQKVRAPRIREVCTRADGAQTAYWVEDLGDMHFVHQPTLEHMEQVLELRRNFSKSPIPLSISNARWALDETLFLKELRIFQDYADSASGVLAKDCQALAKSASEKPWAPQHRDFHSRNLLFLETGEVACIDYQDLRPGPVLYDLASLATDAYYDVSELFQKRLLREACEVGDAEGWSEEKSKEIFRVTQLQRVWKALGTFGRLIQEGRTDYEEPQSRARIHVTRILS